MNDTISQKDFEKIKLGDGLLAQIKILPVYYIITYEELVDAFVNIVYEHDPDIEKRRMELKS